MSRQEITEKISNARDLNHAIIVDLEQRIKQRGFATFVRGRYAHKLAQRAGYRIQMSPRNSMFVRIYPKPKVRGLP